ncbi:MAG: type II toxin-antitoxin system VapC family toxin [Chloroflexi bacterium]|nr:type II toxin-antitoxin system VapC family toxin [Chloroflexota bacterium]
MNYLIDTCVISEYTRKTKNERVIGWLKSIQDQDLFISVITVGEIQHGIERLPDSHRKTELQSWMSNDLIEKFGDRILTLDTQTMFVWGGLVARLEKTGHPTGLMDSLIASVALSHNLIVATRNIDDFSYTGVQLINPWN